MNILPTFRSERAKRVGRIVQAWAITLSMTLGSFTAAWVARDFHGAALMKEQTADFNVRLGENDAAHNEEIARLTTANNRVVSELSSRVAEQAQVITTLSLTVESLANTTQSTSDKVEKAAESARRASSTSQQAVRKATQAVQEARSPITEDSRRDINQAIDKANEKLKR